MTFTRYIFIVLLAACARQPKATTSAPPASPATPSPTSTTNAASFEVAADSPFAPLRGLLGEWRGEDPDHHSTGSFTLGAELGGKVLVRHNHDDSPQGHHEDLMIVFASPAGLRAAYFDNEGHAIDYGITTGANGIEFLSDEADGRPRFRLRYEVHGPDELAIDFAIAPPGASDFQHYTGGVVHRVSSVGAKSR